MRLIEDAWKSATAGVEEQVTRVKSELVVMVGLLSQGPCVDRPTVTR
jgi:hypothetical protein